MKIFRELADLLGTHRAIEDLTDALLNHARVVRGLSDSVCGSGSGAGVWVDGSGGDGVGDD